MRRDFEIEIPKPLTPENIGHGFALATTLQIARKTLALLVGRHALRPSVQKAARLLQGMSKQ